MEIENRPNAPAGQGVAITAEALFLTNLLLVPGLAFVVLGWLWWRRAASPPLARGHLEQTFNASIAAGVLLVIVSVVIVLAGGFDSAITWTVVLLYFICCHSALILFGMVGLARAMAGRPYRYPLIGRFAPDETPKEP